MKLFVSHNKKFSAAADDGSCNSGTINSEKKSSRLLLLRRIVIFLITLFFFGAFAPLGVDFHHDGIMMIPALRVASGAMVFRDVFCQYGFLSPVLQGFAAWISGGELLALKFLSVLFYAGSAVLLDMIWANFLSPRWRDGIVVLYFILMPDLIVTFHPWSSIFALFFMLLAMYWLMNYFTAGSRWLLAASGVTAGLVFLARHPCGVVSIIAIAGALFCEAMIKYCGMERIKKLLLPLGIAMLGSGVVLGSAALFLVLTGAWDDFVLQCYTYVFNFVQIRGSGGSGPASSSWHYFASSLCPFITDSGFFDSIFAVLPFFALGWLAKAVHDAVRRPETRTEMLKLSALAIFALGSWHQYYPVPCVRHIFWGGVPFFGFFVLSLRFWWCECTARRMWYRGLAVISVLLALFCAYQRLYSGTVRLYSASRRPQLDIPGIRGMKLSRGEFKLITNVKNHIDSLPESIRKRGVVNYTRDGLWEVLLPDSGFRHPQFLQMGTALYPDYDRRIMEYISEKRPSVLSNQMLFLYGYTPAMFNKYMGETYILYVPDY